MMAKRIFASTRIQFANTRTLYWVPLVVLVGVYIISFIIYAAIPGDEMKMGGGLQAPLWFYIAFGAQLLAFYFPFALALGLTRGEFYMGFILNALLCGLVFGSIITLGGVLERLSHGWWIEGYFFYLPWMWQAGWGGAWFLTASIVWLFMSIGFTFAAIYKRWGMLFLALILLIFALGLAIAMVVITRTDAWIEVFTWFAGFGPGEVANFVLLCTVMSVFAGWMVLRRMAIR